ncbi:PREDICTED: LOW QUALITY PROTEIN [Prunus dulcis]|uniref:PREDICTED: LOW QUALITY PROTEIN n=1 Tax=Prunus dulcis TaxID=3755 RepID=A0A5E4EZR7_PRUDU|nr:PREDICTED: LOW QUALITY PROTEIN [Prunus dulcis]
MCEDSVEVSIAMGLLVSQLSQEPWKGKVINYHEDSPQLELIQGGHDLRYKYESLRRRMITCDHTAFREMFDLILEEAVKRNLKPEQMVKKLFVFNHPGFKRFVEVNDWMYIYNDIKSKFEDKGYGNVHWNLSEYNKNKPLIPYKQPGLTVLTGFSNKLLKLFLENDGEFGPEHVMEVAISGDEFQSLAVVD